MALADALPAPVARVVAPFAGHVRRHARLLATLAALLYIGGAAWSFRNLGISPWHLKPLPLLVLAFLLVPLSQSYGATGMVLLARAAGLPMRWGTALRTNSYAQLAEVLPLPGGAIVRAGALVGVGASKRGSALLVTAGAVLWISVATVAAGAVLANRGNAAGLALLAGGTAVTAATTGWLLLRSDWRTALALLAHRTAGLFLTAIRLFLCFSAVGVAMHPAETLPFALAIIAGSASSIAPAGLGVSEAMAALIAGTMATAPAAAFLAVALNRFVGLVMTACFVLIDQARTTETAA